MLEKLCVKVKQISVTAGIELLKIYNEYKRDKCYYINTNTNTNTGTILLVKAINTINKILRENLIRLKLSTEFITVINPSDHSRKGIYWLVNPLDGMEEFVNEHCEITINISLIMDGFPLLGVSHSPIRKEIYWAFVNGGAWKCEKGITRKLQVAIFEPFSPGLIITRSERDNSSEITKFIKNNFAYPQIIQTGNDIIKLLLVAEGDAHISLGLNGSVSAGDIIIKEAGGLLLNLSTNSPINYNEFNKECVYFIASGIQKIENL